MRRGRNSFPFAEAGGRSRASTRAPFTGRPMESTTRPWTKAASTGVRGLRASRRGDFSSPPPGVASSLTGREAAAGGAGRLAGLDAGAAGPGRGGRGSSTHLLSRIKVIPVARRRRRSPERTKFMVGFLSGSPMPMGPEFYVFLEALFRSFAESMGPGRPPCRRRKAFRRDRRAPRRPGPPPTIASGRIIPVWEGRGVRDFCRMRPR